MICPKILKHFRVDTKKSQNNDLTKPTPLKSIYKSQSNQKQ